MKKQKKHYIARILISHPAIVSAPDQLEKVERQLWKMKKIVLKIAADYRRELIENGYDTGPSSRLAVAFAAALNRHVWKIEANTN